MAACNCGKYPAGATGERFNSQNTLRNNLCYLLRRTKREESTHLFRVEQTDTIEVVVVDDDSYLSLCLLATVRVIFVV